jgi:hypothetical protein
MQLHGLGVGARHDDGGAGAAFRADGAEDVGLSIALILGLAAARA